MKIRIQLLIVNVNNMSTETKSNFVAIYRALHFIAHFLPFWRHLIKLKPE